MQASTTARQLGRGKAYLTFDDGPSPAVTPKILATLKQYNIKATFFVIGKDDPVDRGIIKSEFDGGNTVGVHSWTHDYSYIYSSESNFMTDFDKITNLVFQVTGQYPSVFRFPGGTSNTVSLRINKGVPIMPKLLDDVETAGLQPYDWNAYAGDAERKIPSREQVVNNVVGECAALHGKDAIILCHDGTRASPVTLSALPEIITRLTQMGYTFGPLTKESDELIFKTAH